MLSAASLVRRLRHPEYTGENRCWPCTVANTLIAAAGSLAVATWAAVLGSPVTGAVAAAVAFAVGAAAIALRGYLVPGTPTLTERYLPEPVLRAFGKQPAGPRTVEIGSETVDAEDLLVDLGALERSAGGLRLAEPFRREWRERVEAVAGDEASALLAVRGRANGSVAFADRGDSLVATVDGRRVGRWVSRTALRADLAAAAAVADRFDGWSALSATERGEVAAALRLFLETCPDCEGDLAAATEPLESCCADRTVATLACEDCGVRVFESLARGSSAV